MIWQERRRPKRPKNWLEAKELQKGMETRECHWRLASKGFFISFLAFKIVSNLMCVILFFLRDADLMREKQKLKEEKAAAAQASGSGTKK